jgi:catechol 2,3-dioxygenase-like lactoylglutathione lyase family enzyme
MNRFHVHVSVADLNKSIGFYSKLFGQQPSIEKPDYAKWMLDDPRINFAISQRAIATGVEHLGIQVESADALKALTSRLHAADLAVVDEGATTCCYAQSDKGWVHDPDGIAWESFYTSGDSTTYSAPDAVASESACCTPVKAVVGLGMPSVKKAEATKGCCA